MMAPNPVVLSKRILAQSWGTLTEFSLRLQRRDGRTVEFERECYARAIASSVLLHDPIADTVVLVRQFRLGTFLNGDPYLVLETAAGSVEGDDPEESAKREAIEETGYRPTDLRLVCIAYGQPGAVTEKVSLFIGHYQTGNAVAAGGGLEEEGEDIEVVELPFRQALSMIASGEIIDMKTIILLQALALERYHPNG
jgi:nudix-type nucleoside diphosphatase (YffH/AdpP family)